MRDEVALQATTNPERTALVDAETGRSWTFAGLDDAVAQTAGRLAGLGVEPGDRVAVLAETRPAFAELVFAAARLGVVLVPLNARLTRSELAEQVNTVDPVLVVTEAESVEDARELGPPVASVDDVDSDGVRELSAVDPAEFEGVDSAWSDTRLLLFTSGTTGAPKAVRLTYGNLGASAVASAFRLGMLPDDSWLCPLSMYHTGGVSVVLRCALYGTTAVLVRTPGFDPDSVRDALAEYDCTGVSLVPTMLDRLLDTDAGLPDSLRFALVGGAPTPPELAERALDAGVPVCPTYGATETASQVATLRPEQVDARPGSVGRPLLGTEVTVLDDDGDPLPAGETGDLAVSGPTVTPGYVSADETAARFCEHGLRTGDRGRVDGDGFLSVGGRASDEIVTGGENVHPGEVADVLRDHPGVRDVAVVGVPDDDWGERVGALVVPIEDASTADVSVDALRAFCEDRLAGYKHPRTVAVVDALPRTPSGTVDREAAIEALGDDT
ncbi:class I adenylate-forming enzyme family protein [Halobacterium rubrum]|uniref:class I adenylate-forming enzyme family protein n=1 Tax=Halobacterium TaxID=2239 RepID=UPI001F2DC723|nr:MULTISPECIES: class I adenylate-forming enzyme family protein [Halobacterium]MDH5021349.1 class I adenylate-forming enzyme family protein [Halobacterium rubrum]